MRLEYCLRAGAACALRSPCPLAACSALTKTVNGCLLIVCFAFTVSALQADQQLDERMSTCLRINQLWLVTGPEDTGVRRVHLVAHMPWKGVIDIDYDMARLSETSGVP